MPLPDDTIFLDVPPEVSFRLMKKRAEADKKHFTDIHEANKEYLVQCYEAACFAASVKKWHTVTCTKNGEMRAIDDIGDEIFAYVSERIKEKRKESE